MKPLQIAEDIVPLARFKAQTSQVLRQLHREQRPVVITQNGKPAAVLITPEEYDLVQEQRRFMGAVQEGLDDVEAGRFIAELVVEWPRTEPGRTGAAAIASAGPGVRRSWAALRGRGLSEA